jgi:hypothetical protein
VLLDLGKKGKLLFAYVIPNALCNRSIYIRISTHVLSTKGHIYLVRRAIYMDRGPAYCVLPVLFLLYVLTHTCVQTCSHIYLGASVSRVVRAHIYDIYVR